LLILIHQFTNSVIDQIYEGYMEIEKKRIEAVEKDTLF